MPYKKFVFLILALLSLFSLYHYIVFTLYSSKIFAREDKLYIGDIARVSYQTDPLFPRKLEYTLPKKHLNKKQYHQDMNIDILTIGDSFSNAATGGLNPYYQDYLATDYNKTVLNIVNTKGGKLHIFSPIIALYNNGWLKKHHVKTVIIQSVERFCVTRFTKKFDFNTKDINLKNNIASARTHDSYIPQIKFISEANYKLPYYQYQATKKIHFHTDVMLFKLNKKLFSPINFTNKLLIHHEDILSLPYNNYESIKRLNQNFNLLAKKLSAIGTTLVFMPTVDKYDLYYPYISTNPYQKNNFFDIIRKMKKNYVLIDTKEILQKQLTDGVLDIYYPDDSHWSFKAIATITKSQIFHTLLQGSNNAK